MPMPPLEPSPPVEAKRRALAQGVTGANAAHALLNPGAPAMRYLDAHEKYRSLPRRRPAAGRWSIDWCGGAAGCGRTFYLGRMLVLSAGGCVPRRVWRAHPRCWRSRSMSITGTGSVGRTRFRVLRRPRGRGVMPSFSARDDIYTPQIVVDGRWQAVGSDRSAVERRSPLPGRSGRGMPVTLRSITGRRRSDRIGRRPDSRRFGTC